LIRYRAINEMMNAKSKWGLVCLAWLAPVTWVCVLFFPDVLSLEDKRRLLWLIAISVMHMPIGAVLVWCAGLGFGRFSLAFSGFLAPLAHFAGASLEPPWCVILFVGPAVASALLGVLELRYA